MAVVKDSYLIEVRPRTCLRIRTSSMFKRIRFDDGRERTMTLRMLLAHCDYGYAGTTHKVQGQTSEIHIASLDRSKDAASLYVSATRARDLAPPSPDGSGTPLDRRTVRRRGPQPHRGPLQRPVRHHRLSPRAPTRCTRADSAASDRRLRDRPPQAVGREHMDTVVEGHARLPETIIVVLKKTLPSPVGG